MRYTQLIEGYVTTARGKLQNEQLFIDIDFDALTLKGHDMDGEIDESFDDIAALQERYAALAEAIFADERLEDPEAIEGGPIEDLAAFGAELRACGFDREVPPLDPDDRLEVAVARLCRDLRRELNRAFGPEPAAVENLLLCTDDGRIHVAYVNIPAFCGQDEAAIHALIGTDDSWETAEGPEHRRLRLPIRHEDYIYAPPAWSDANLSYDYRSAFLDLVGVRLEAEPGFRPNLTVREPLLVLHTVHESIWLNPERRALARSLRDRPASVFLDRVFERLTAKG